jgi:prepilin-type N-terminal cleavage/methylation domain-containing protein
MKSARAFSLLELLVVVGLIAVLAVTAIGTFGKNEATALRAAQASLANLVVAARTKAVATNRPVRLLINIDVGSPDRFLRKAVLQIQEGAAWTTLGEAAMPDGVYVVPGNFALPPGLLAAGAAGWTRNDGSSLRSTAFRSANLLTEAILSPDPETWMALPADSG